MLKMQQNSMEIRMEFMKTLLHNLAVTAEFSARYGLSPKEVRHCLQEALAKLDETFPEGNSEHNTKESRQGRKKVHLEAAELHILLDGFEPQA